MQPFIKIVLKNATVISCCVTRSKMFVQGIKQKMTTDYNWCSDMHPLVTSLDMGRSITRCQNADL